MKFYCNLCGAKLTGLNKCNAHIIPKFLWKEYMDESGQHEELILLKKYGAPARLLKSYGLTDSQILCKKCDDEILGKYENDFKEVWERVFKNGKLHPVEKGDKLYGWAKETKDAEDMIKTKLFILCCIWRASISDLEDYPLKLNSRKEEAIRKILIKPNRKKLLHIYRCICSKFEDADYNISITMYRSNNNKAKVGLIYFFLPGGYAFTMRLGLEPIYKDMGAAEFGAFRDCFFIANSGKLEGSEGEKKLFVKMVRGLRSMYESDKSRLTNRLQEKYRDLTKSDIEMVLNE